MPEPEQRPEILIVDDVPENIDMLGEVLKPYFRRKAALSGEKALRIAASDRPPDLILLDVMMPEMDGYEVCRRLKADERTRDIPIIFVTAKVEVQDETEGFGAGAVDYITKPIIPAIVLARVRAHLELKEARETIERQNAAMLHDLAMARRVQLGLVPTEDLSVQGLDFAFLYEPATQVGGDVLDIVQTEDGWTVILVADVMGHGVQAALVMTAVKSALLSALRTSRDPARILGRMNRHLGDLFAEHFVTAVCCVIDAAGGAVEFALAGHAGPLRHRAGESSVLEPGEGSLPLGLDPDEAYEGVQLGLAQGDVLLFCTDGIVEAADRQGEQFGLQRMRDLLTAHADRPAQEVLHALAGALSDHCGPGEMDDDLTVLVVKCVGGE